MMKYTPETDKALAWIFILAMVIGLLIYFF
jgi:hypothetical protein